MWTKPLGVKGEAVTTAGFGCVSGSDGDFVSLWRRPSGLLHVIRRDASPVQRRERCCDERVQFTLVSTHSVCFNAATQLKPKTHQARCSGCDGRPAAAE